MIYFYSLTFSNSFAGNDDTFYKEFTNHSVINWTANAQIFFAGNF